MGQFKSTNFTQGESISLSQEIVVLGIQSTPLTSMLLAKGNIEKAMATVHTWREKVLDNTEDISAEEGAETTVFQASVRRELNNILQIFKKAVSVSGTAEAMQRNQFPSEIADRLLELKINLEKTLINGLKDDGSVSGIRKMSGLLEFAGQTATGTLANTVDAIQGGMRTLWEADLAEGEYYAFVNADAKAVIDDFYKDSYQYQHKTTNFGLLVETINTNFGIVNVVLSKHVPTDKVLLFNEKYVDLVALREAHFEPLAKTGDSVKGQVVGEYTVKVGSDKAVVNITLG